MSEESGKNYFMKQIKVLSKTNRYFYTFNLNKLLSVDFEEEIIRIFLPKNTGTDMNFLEPHSSTNVFFNDYCMDSHGRG